MSDVCEVSSGVFVPVCFCLLPDKKKESYQVMFSLLKECLESSGLELSDGTKTEGDGFDSFREGNPS